MVASVIRGVGLAGLVACVPRHRETTDDLAARFGADAAGRIAAATGIRARHLAGPGDCASDFAEAAARRLMAGLGWDPGSVDLLVNVCQTPDHLLPASGFRLHHRLGLGRHAAVLDLALGCSGYVYGLWTAASLLAAGGGRRALLLAGDTTSRVLDPMDRSVAPLFGDAAAATALVADPAAPAIHVSVGSDGAGAPYLAVSGGGLRHPDEPRHLFMDGTQVFAFTLREVPGSVRAALDQAGWSMADVDHLVLHQANAQMVRHLARKLGATPEQTVLALEEYGNTSSASLPLALVVALGDVLTRRSRRLLLSGFGVGWSWGSAAVEAGPLAVCERIEVAGAADPAEPAGPAIGAAASANPAGR